MAAHPALARQESVLENGGMGIGVNAANALGRGDSFGSIAHGKIADVIAMKIDPITHIDQLGAVGKVSFVMKAGQVFKDER